MKKSITLFFALVFSLLMVFTACDDVTDALDDALGDTTGGVKGKVTDVNGAGIEGATVYVIGAVNAIAAKPTQLSSAVKDGKIDVDALVGLLEGTGGLKTETTDSSGNFSADLVDAAYIVYVKKDQYGNGLAGIHVDKTIENTLKDMKKADYSLPATLDTSECEFVLIASSLTSKIERNFQLAGGPAPVQLTDAQLSAQEPPAPAVPAAAPASTEWSSAPTTKVTPSGDTTSGKDYYPLSFAFITGTEGSASGEYSVSDGQPVPVSADTTYTWDDTNKWNGGSAIGEFDSSEQTNMITLTGCVPNYANSVKILVYELYVNNQWVTSKHYIGFDESGIYETRTIYLPKGFKTRLSMAEDDGDNFKNQSFTVTFDATGSSETNPYIAIMTYNKGVAVEASKSPSNYNATCDMDFSVTNVKSGITTAWYNSNNNDAFLTYDTWFGFGPEIIVGKVGSDISSGITVDASAYYMQSSDAPLEMHITIVTATGAAKFTKTYKHEFNATGDSWAVGTFDANGNASSRR